MPAVKFINRKGKYHDDDAASCVAHYIFMPCKTPSRLYGGVNVDMADPAASMQEVTMRSHKSYGVRLRHLVISFLPEQVPELRLLEQVGQSICMEIGRRYQALYSVHEDEPDHPHIHIVFNSVSWVDGYKYRGDKKSYYELLNCIRHVLRYYQLGYPMVVHDNPA